MGASQLMVTAQMHPRLFETMVMIDPAISNQYVRSMPAMLKYTLRKPETYKTREQAEKSVRNTPFFKGWEQKPLQRYIDSAFHSSPTVAQPNDSIKPTTSKHMEALALLRPNPQHVMISAPASDVQRHLHPNLDNAAPLTGPGYNPHSRIAWFLLPTLRPSALYLLGEGSHIVTPSEIEERTMMTGTDVGGSGGVAAGNVKSVTVPGGHFLPMTNVQGTAKAVAQYLGDEIEKFRQREEAINADWRGTKLVERQRLGPTALKKFNEWDGKPWAKPEGFTEKSRL